MTGWFSPRDGVVSAAADILLSSVHALALVVPREAAATLANGGSFFRWAGEPCNGWGPLSRSFVCLVKLAWWQPGEHS